MMNNRRLAIQPNIFDFRQIDLICVLFQLKAMHSLAAPVVQALFDSLLKKNKINAYPDFSAADASLAKTSLWHFFSEQKLPAYRLRYQSLHESPASIEQCLAYLHCKQIKNTLDNIDQQLLFKLKELSPPLSVKIAWQLMDKLIGRLMLSDEITYTCIYHDLAEIFSENVLLDCISLYRNCQFSAQHYQQLLMSYQSSTLIHATAPAFD